MKKLYIIFVVIIIGGLVFGLNKNADKTDSVAGIGNKPSEIVREKLPAGQKRAVFAAGCFWCSESAFQETPGVSAAISGYAGGKEYNPTYEDTYKNKTGHKESVMVYYDPSVISYNQLLDIFWKTIDPTDAVGQFVDKGPSYVAAIFYETPEQKQLAEASKQALIDSGRFDQPIVTPILPYTTFYEAEEYHQDFYIKSSERYEAYKNASGREDYKNRVWAEIKKEQQ